MFIDKEQVAAKVRNVDETPYPSRGGAAPVLIVAVDQAYTEVDA